MKLIDAVIHPGKVDDVLAALMAIGIEGLTLTEVHASGPPVAVAIYRGATPVPVDTMPLARIEIVAADFKATQVVEAVWRAARVGSRDEGVVAVLPLDDVLRVRTGESGESAL
jgi:nitrogen regulatory protein PII